MKNSSMKHLLLVTLFVAPCAVQAEEVKPQQRSCSAEAYSAIAGLTGKSVNFVKAQISAHPNYAIAAATILVGSGVVALYQKYMVEDDAQ